MNVKEIDIRDAINEKIESQGRKLTWLAKEININYNTLYSILVQKTINLSDDNKAAINKALDTSF